MRALLKRSDDRLQSYGSYTHLGALQQNQTLDPSPTLKGNFQKLLPANFDENFLIKMES